MSPSNLPQKLWRPLSEVKSFLEKMPDGVKVSEVTRKVNSFSALSSKEKNSLIEFLNERESILVVKAKPEGGKNNVVFLRHKKFGFPNELPGFVITTKSRPSEGVKKTCSKCKQGKGLSEFYANSSNNDGRQTYCIECVKKTTTERDWKKGDNYAKRADIAPTITESEPMTEKDNKPSPEQLRKQAEKLLKEAEDAERAANNNDIFNKKLQPVRLELLQAIGGVQRKFDEMMDCMSILEKASAKLRDLQP